MELLFDFMLIDHFEIQSLSSEPFSSAETSSGYIC